MSFTESIAAARSFRNHGDPMPEANQELFALGLAKIRREELVWALIAFAGVIVLGTLAGILVAVLISILTLIAQANRPPVYAMGRKPDTDVFRP